MIRRRWVKGVAAAPGPTTPQDGTSWFPLAYLQRGTGGLMRADTRARWMTRLAVCSKWNQSTFDCGVSAAPLEGIKEQHKYPVMAAGRSLTEASFLLRRRPFLSVNTLIVSSAAGGGWNTNSWQPTRFLVFFEKSKVSHHQRCRMTGMTK